MTVGRRACVRLCASVYQCVRQLLLFFKFIGSQVSREVRINGNVLPKPKQQPKAARRTAAASLL